MSSMLPERLLVLSPHSDDEAYGAAGLISKTARNGGAVHVVFGVVGDVTQIRNGERRLVTGAERLDEVRAVASILGYSWDVMFARPEGEVDLGNVSTRRLVGMLEPTIERFDPTHVIGCGPSTHQDHMKMYEVLGVLARPGYRPQTTFAAYDPHALIGSHHALPANVLVQLEDADVEAKAKAMAAYKSQQSARGLNGDVVAANNELLGMRHGFASAESLSLIRMVMN